MTKIFNHALVHAAAQSSRLFRDINGATAPGFGISLTGLGISGLACALLFNASFNVQSSSLGTDLLKALNLF